ncbi:hypothetical protein DPMN_000891 [Dreissena polymorpha]|uniref:Uncharacterized protein n=1 Tax=Dreissena polymorpha TaxID=45954 RepID=A0A9D4RSJ7_DREPO|nr:hypothetical protein DPMN_000891 [Dreissena polymorpha]
METPAIVRNSIKPMHWGCPWTWNMHTSMFRSIPTIGSTCASPFEARCTSFGLCRLDWRPPHEFLPNSWLQSVHTSGTLLLQYFDDWLLHQLDRQLLLRNLDFSWKELISLELFLNADKSDLILSQDFTFVGMNFFYPHQSGQGFASTYLRPPGEGQLDSVPISYNSLRIPLSQRYP